MAIGHWEEPEELDFFTDYLSHILLSGHNDRFNKYVKNIFLQKFPTAPLMSGQEEEFSTDTIQHAAGKDEHHSILCGAAEQ